MAPWTALALVSWLRLAAGLVARGRAGAQDFTPRVEPPPAAARSRLQPPTVRKSRPEAQPRAPERRSKAQNDPSGGGYIAIGAPDPEEALTYGFEAPDPPWVQNREWHFDNSWATAYKGKEKPNFSQNYTWDKTWNGMDKDAYFQQLEEEAKRKAKNPAKIFFYPLEALLEEVHVGDKTLMASLTDLEMDTIHILDKAKIHEMGFWEYLQSKGIDPTKHLRDDTIGIIEGFRNKVNADYKETQKPQWVKDFEAEDTKLANEESTKEKVYEDIRTAMKVYQNVAKHGYRVTGKPGPVRRILDDWERGKGIGVSSGTSSGDEEASGTSSGYRTGQKKKFFGLR